MMRPRRARLYLGFRGDQLMSMNHVQFQPGLSLREFFHVYGSERACERVLERARWPHGFECAQCNGTRATVFRRRALRY